MTHDDFIKSLPYEKPYAPQHPEAARLIADIKAGKKPVIMHGVLGEWAGSDAYAGAPIKPESGGTFLPIYGISYQFKGYPTAVQVHGLDLPKAIMSGWLREIIGGSVLLSSAILLLFVFRRRRFIHLANLMLYDVTLRTVRWLEPPEKEFNVPVRELKRASYAVIGRLFHVSGTDTDLPTPYDKQSKEQELGHVFLRATRFIGLFLEMDAAYRFRVQDAFGKPTKASGLERFYEGLQLLLSRESKTGVAHKWKFVRYAIRTAFLVLPELKRFIAAVFEEVDWAKVAMDESDWYFCLRYHSYNFGGLDQEARFALRDKIDEEKGHVFLI